MQHDPNQDPAKPSSDGPDDDMIAFASEVFDVARRGDAAMLDALLSKGLPPNLRSDRGDSLVMLASYHGHADAVRVLLEHKADPDLRNDNGQTPIAGAAFKGFRDVIETLLGHGADVEGASPDGRTALMIAAMFNRVEIVELLIARGAEPDARDAAEKMGAPDTAAKLAQATNGRVIVSQDADGERLHAACGSLRSIFGIPDSIRFGSAHRDHAANGRRRARVEAIRQPIQAIR